MTALFVSALALAGAASVVADDSGSSSSPALGLAGPSWSSSSSSSSWRGVNLADPNAWLESLRARAETIAESRASVSDIYRPLFLASPEGEDEGEGEGGDRERDPRGLGRFDVGPAPGAAGGVAPLLDPDDPIVGRLTLDALELADEIAVTTAPDGALAAKDAAAVLAEQADLAFASLQDAKDDPSSSSASSSSYYSSAAAFAAAYPTAATVARIAAGAETYPFASGAASADGVSGFSGGAAAAAYALETFAANAYAAAFDAEERATHAALARDAAATMIEKTLSTQAKAPVGTYFAPEEKVADASRWLDELRAARAEEYRAAAAAAAAEAGGAATATRSAREGAAYADELREGDAGLRARAAAALGA
jgi:hypothetical protein